MMPLPRLADAWLDGTLDCSMAELVRIEARVTNAKSLACYLLGQAELVAQQMGPLGKPAHDALHAEGERLAAYARAVVAEAQRGQ